MKKESGNMRTGCDSPEKPHQKSPRKPPHSPLDKLITAITWLTPLLVAAVINFGISARKAEMAANKAREAAAQLASQRRPPRTPSDCREIPPGETCPDGQMTRVHFMVRECCGNHKKSH